MGSHAVRAQPRDGASHRLWRLRQTAFGSFAGAAVSCALGWAWVWAVLPLAPCQQGITGARWEKAHIPARETPTHSTQAALREFIQNSATKLIPELRQQGITGRKRLFEELRRRLECVDGMHGPAVPQGREDKGRRGGEGGCVTLPGRCMQEHAAV